MIIYCPCGCGEEVKDVMLIKLAGAGYVCPCSECKKEIAGEIEQEDLLEDIFEA